MSDPIQASKGDWDELAKSSDKKQSSGDSNKLRYMKFDAPGNYRVRLIGDHVEFHKYFTPINAISHPDIKSKDPAWQAGFYPRKRCAIHVIDRSDGQLKILERGWGLFKKFANYKAVKGINPAGKDGPDFIITVKMPKDKNGNYIKRSTEYEIMPDEKAPLTADEMKMIKETGLYNLSQIYKTTPLEKIQEMWDNLPADKKIPPKKNEDGDDAPPVSNTEGKVVTPQQKKPDVAEKMPDSPADNGEDLFGDKKSEKSKPGDDEPLF